MYTFQCLGGTQSLTCLSNDYVEDMVTFTVLAEIYSAEYFCNAKVAGLDKIFVLRKFSPTVESLSYGHCGTSLKCL